MSSAPFPSPVPVCIIGLGLPVRNSPVESAVYPLLSHPVVQQAEVLIGGRALLELLADHPAEKMAVDRNTADLYAAIEANSNAGLRQTVLCSGDPLFYGLGARLRGVLGPERLRVIPGLSSLQAAAACLGLEWERVSTVSLHGRTDMTPLAIALAGAGSIFVLADASLTPAGLALWLLERGCGAYRLHMLENMYVTPEGEVRAGRRLSLSLEEAALLSLEMGGQVRRVFWLEPAPVCVGGPCRPFGLPDAEVRTEKGLLTKGPVRAAALAALGIEPGDVIWDLGAGSGAVSLEAARLAWRGSVFAVECKPSRLENIRRNRKRFGVMNLEIVAGTLPFCLPLGPHDPLPDNPAVRQPEDVCHSPLPRPHRIFIGGGLGGEFALAETILIRAWSALLPGGRLLADCVLLSSLERVRTILLGLGATVSITCLQSSHGSPLAGDIRLAAHNPVFLVLAEKPLDEGGN